MTSNKDQELINGFLNQNVYLVNVSDDRPPDLLWVDVNEEQLLILGV